MRGRLLIVDDDPLFIKTLSETLGGEYDALCAESGGRALDILRARAGEIDAVVLGAALNDISGADALAAIRENERTARMPVIMLARELDDALEQKALALGANDIMTKRSSITKLKYILSNAISARRAMDKLRKETESLRLSEERYKIAASSGGRVTALYDIKTRKYFRNGMKLSNVVKGGMVDDVPDAFINARIVAPECAEDYRAFYERIRGGERTSGVNIAVLVDKDVYRWFHCEATMIFDSDGSPSQAVIVYNDITEQREKETVYKKWQQALHMKPPESYTLYRCNLSRDAYYDSVEGLLIQAHFKDSTSFNARTLEYATKYVHPDDRDNYIAALSADALIANYHREKRMETLEYRETLPDGMLRWLRLTIELVEYPDSSDIEAYLMYEDIDESKTADMEAKEMAENDPLTGVLNQAAFAQRMEKMLKTHMREQHTLLLLDIDGFKLLNDTFGQASGDQALIDIAKTLRSVLRQGDLLGRLSGDGFLVFMKDVPYDAVIVKKAKQICSRVRKAYNMEVQISANMGIAVYPRDGESFGALYKCAEAALYSAKNAGKDNFVFFASEQNGLKPLMLASEPNSQQARASSVTPKRRMLIVDDSRMNRDILAKLFEDEFYIETAKDGAAALMILRRYGAGISIALLDLVMPGMDGFEVLEKMQASVDTRSIPVIVVSAQDEQETSLRAIRLGAADYIAKPVDPALIRLRVQSAISKAENERLRAQNSYLLLQSSEEAKYRTVLDSTGTVVIEYDWVNGVFTYDPSITAHIAGNYDKRRLWQIFMTDMVADALDVKSMQDLVYSVANDRKREDGSMMVMLKIPSGQMHWFRMRVFKRADEYQLTDKMIITYIDANEEVLSEEKLRFRAQRDELTGAYNRTVFFEKAAEYILSREPGYYVLGCFDINSFKLINDQYGSEKGDEVLKHVARVFNEDFERMGGLVGRIMADNFAVLYPARYMDTDELAEIRARAAALDGSIPPVSFSIGRYLIDDPSLSVSAMYDRAVLAEASVKGRFDDNIAMYDESMRERLINEQQIVNEMNRALKERQFEVWLQPQYNHATGALIGAEALVRWRHPAKGLVPPGIFIPVFERNGFIYELDKYVWEETCALIRKWIDEGRAPLPVSVNISRYDLFREDLISNIVGLTRKYALPMELLRLEITESAFSESADKIIKVVKSLIDYGYTVEIDDFGSGYSSLNTLKDVPAQVLKMDMRFLTAGGDSDRGGNILESVVRMAKWLGMSVIAEGVELEAQADFLKSIGCIYVQGYLYAKPMPPAEYEKLAETIAKEQKLDALETAKNLNNNSFWNPESMDTLIFNSYVGGACIFEYHNGNIELLRATDKYAQVIGSAGMTVEDALKLDWKNHLDAENSEKVRRDIMLSIETRDEVMTEYTFINLPGCPPRTYLRSTLRVIASAGDHYLIYCTNENMTSQREAELRERKLSEQMQAVMDNVASGISAVLVDGERVDYIFANDRFYDIHGYTRARFEAEVKNTFDLIHPDDRRRIYKAAQEVNRVGNTATLEYRVLRGDGREIWVRGIITTRLFVGIDKPVQFTVFTDITENKLAEKKLRESAEQLRFLNDTAGDLLAKPDISAGINTVLKKVLNFFGAARSFIYEYDYERQAGINSYECYAEGVEPYTQPNQIFPLEVTKYWRDSFDSTDFFKYDAAERAGEERKIERDVNQSHGIRSILAVALRVDGKLIGTLGVDNPESHLSDYDNLKALGDYMAVILTRRNLMRRIESDKESLSNMMNDTPGGFSRLRLTPSGRFEILYANENLCKMRGMTKEQIISKGNGDAIHNLHPDDCQKVLAAVDEMILTGETRRTQYRIKHKSGKFIPVNALGRVSRSEAGEIFINVFYTELTEQEKKDFGVREMLPFILSAIMKSSADLTFAKDRDFKYICCSPAFAELAGQADEADVIGKTDYELFEKHIADGYRKDDLKLIEGGQSLIDYKDVLPSVDGVPHYATTSKYLLRDTLGNVIGLYGVGRDTTLERTAYEQLKLLTNSIPGGIASYEGSPDGLKLMYFNDGYCGMMGYTHDEYERITQKGAMTITFEEDKPALIERVNALILNDEPLNHTYRIHKKDGGYLWANVRGTVTERRGDKCFFNVVMYDVTETKLAQEAALIHEREMRLAISMPGHVICEYDPAARVLTVPDSYAAMFGLTSGVVKDAPESILRRGIISDKTTGVYRAFYDAIHRGDKTGSAEYIETRPDGSEHWVRVDFASVFASNGKPVKTLITVEDTTEQHLKYELERLRPMLGEENLLVHALFNLSTGETLEYAYADGSEVPVSARTAFLYGGDNLEDIIINERERARYRELNDPKKLLERYRQGEKEISIDYRRRMRSGEILWVRNLLHMIVEPGGSDILLFEYCYNIDEEKTIEQINNSIVNNNYDFIARINGTTHSYVMFNNPGRKFAEPVQRADDIDVISREMAEKHVHPDDIETTLNNTLVEGIKRNLKREEPFRFTYRELQPDGQVLYKKLTQYYLDRERDIIVVIREDVTEMMREETRKNELLKRALKAANEESRVKEREAAAQLTAIMNNVDGGVSAATLIDGEIGYLYVNDMYFSMFGYTKAQFESELKRGLVDLIHPDDIQTVIDSAKASESSGKARMEFRAYKRDGGMVWIRSISSVCELTGISAPVHIAVLFDITKEKQTADDLRMSEEQFRIAATTGGRAIARYDIRTGAYHHHDEILLAMGFSEVVNDVPRAFVSAGNIAHEFVDEYLEFYEKIKRGERNIVLDSLIRVADGEYRWCRQEATVIFDAHGAPSQAIIVISDITELREKEAAYKKWRQSLRQRPKREYTLFKCNLSKDMALGAVEGELIQFEYNAEHAGFNDWQRAYAAQRVHPEERGKFASLMDLNALLSNYHCGIRVQTLEYREIRPDKPPRWLLITVELVEYPNSSDIEAYLMYEDIDARKQDELINKERAETDPLTGVLNRAAFAEATARMIKERPPDAHIALMMLDIDGFKLINDTFGHIMGDQVLIDTTKALRGALRAGDLLSRFGGDEFLICLPNMPDIASIERKAGQICALMHRALSPEVYTSASIGIAVCPRDGDEFDELYLKLDTALYAVKAHGKNNYAFFTDGMSDEYVELGEMFASDDIQSVLSRSKKPRMLIVDDNQLSLEMLSKLFEEDFTIETATDGADALMCIRRYGAGIAVVLLDLVMPGMDGFAVLEKMRASAEMSTIPVIVVSGMDEHETSLRTLGLGAADFVTKPVNIDLLRLRVRSVISKAENDRLRAQNSLLLMHNTEAAKYRAALENAGATVIEYQPASRMFYYDKATISRLAGNYDDRDLWDILIADNVAAIEDIDALRELVSAAEPGDGANPSALVTLKSASGARRKYRASAIKRAGEGDFPERILITLLDIEDIGGCK